MPRSPRKTSAATRPDNSPSTLADGDPTGEFPSHPNDYLFHLLVAVGRTRDIQLERRMREIGTNLAHHRAMGVISTFGPCTMTTLADISSIDRTTLTRIVDQLVDRRLVDRDKSATDRRQVLLAMTPAGRALLGRSSAMVKEHNHSALVGMSEETKRAIIRGAQILITNLAPSPQVAEELITFQPRKHGAKANS